MFFLVKYPRLGFGIAHPGAEVLDSFQQFVLDILGYLLDMFKLNKGMGGRKGR